MAEYDVWKILERYENWEKHVPSSLRSYAQDFKVELVEIIAQIEGHYPLSGYKLQSHLSNWEKWKIIFKKLTSKSSFGYHKTEVAIAHTAPLLFVVEYVGHYKQLIPISMQLVQQKIRFQVVFLCEDLFERHHKEFENAILLSPKYLYHSLLKSIKIIWLLRKDKYVASMIQPEKRSKWRLEITFFNAKFLNGILSQCASFAILINQIPKAQIIFFKSEGCRIKSLIRICKEHNRRVIAIQHGFIKHEIKYTDLPADIYLTWSEHFSQALSASRAGCKTIVTGCANYDYFFKKRPQKSRILNAQHLHLLFLPNSGNSQTPRSELEFAINLCLDFIRTRPHISLEIKPHPGDHSSFLADQVADAKLGERTNILSRNAPINYANSDIVVTMNSTTGIEGAIFNKPILILLSDLSLIMVEEYLTSGIGIWVNSISSFETAITNIVTNPSIFEKNALFFTRQIIANPGFAAETICEYLLKTEPPKT